MANRRQQQSISSRFRDQAGDIIRAVRLVQSDRAIECSVKAAQAQGFVIGREVFVDEQPGIVVAYNISGMGSRTGAAYPLVVRTANGFARCTVGELRLAP